MSANNLRKPKRTICTIVLFCFVLTQVVSGVFFYVKPAMAQLVVTDPVTGAQTTIKNIKDFLKILVINAGTMALINAASRFAQKIAYDLAVGIASGGKGQMPLFSTDGWGDYMKNAGLDAAGEFIGSFGDMVGVDFCAPPNPRVGLNLQLSLGSIYSGELPAPTCKWSEISSNWDSFVSEVQSEDFLREMASQFKVTREAGTDLDLAMTGFIGAFDASTKAEKSALEERREGQGFKAVEEFISGKVKTPAEVIREASLGIVKDPKMAEEQKQAMMSQALASGGTQILTMFASTFVSTLLSKTMDMILKKGMVSLADLFPKSESTTSEGTAWGGRRAAELAFADLLVPQIKEGGTYDALTDFIVCPDKFKGVNNCVMDGNFEAAVRRAQTGEPLTIGEAIDEKLLHGEWPIIPPSNLAKNQDPYCYTYGYCYSNLVKLRKARVIPIGWEIAAQSQTSTEPVSLKEVVDKFRDCNADGEADAEHKYCHLIDPDWILKAPLGQCRARVYGPLLQTAENSFRQEVCVDTPSCIAEDNQGNCQGGWGYCTREKNIWRLDGDQCDAEYDTCRALARRDGQNVAYTVNTIDYGPPCNADDVGCRWYSTRQSKVGDIWQWQDVLTGSGTSARRNDRIFFNKNITQCDEPGCNEFLRTTADTKFNLVTNGSFEDYAPAILPDGTVVAGSGTPDDAISEKFKDWEPSPMLAVSATYFGKTAIRLPAVGRRIIDIGKPIGGTTFTLSFYVKRADAATACTGVFLLGKPGALGPDQVDISSATASWQRYSISYTGGVTDSSTQLAFGVGGSGVASGANCLLDAVQLEEGASVSNYHEGWGRTGEALYLKTAPDYYSCYDYTSSGALNKTNDAEQCGNYSKACEEKDVGCEQYTPTNGDPFVPGVANYPDDYCPAECVGYQTFKQVATDFEQDKFPVYFIPSTGRTCSAADVGCDQFTSLETEAVANFNYVRRCEKPGVTSAPFYTWEGSDTTGYQLKTWILKISNVLRAEISESDPGSGVPLDGGVPPCTALAADGFCDGLSLVGLCTKADILTNPDCREFYDAAGKKHYRLYSKTIVATDDCHPYRKTISSAADCGTSGGKWDDTKNECVYQIYLPESRSCSNEAVGCRAYRGNAGANTAVIFTTNFDAATDATRDGWSAGSISSESLVVGGKSLALTSGTTTTKDISTSVRKGGLYTLSFWAKGASRLDIKFSGAGSGREFSSAGTNPTNLSFDWRYFSLGPVYVDWDAISTLQITSVGGASPAYLDNIILREIQSYIYVVKNSWATPTSCDSSFTVDSSSTDATACTAAGGSWSTDRNECILAARLPQAQLGCASYYDRTNRLHYLKSFSRLCPVDMAGCEKLIKTGNNDAVTEETYNTENDVNNLATPADETQGLSAEERLSDNVTIPTDSFAYIVVNDANKCAAQNAGCAEFGSPTLDATGNVKLDDSDKPIYDTVNLLADPTLYNSATGRILCQVGFLSCEEYATTDGGKLYFKDPGSRLCEWKDNVLVSGQSVSGWFKKGTDPAEPCDPANFNGGYYNIWKNGDANCSLPYVCQTATGCACTVGTAGATGKTGTTCTVSYGKRTCPYSGWVGECIPQADKCTKFVDPADTSQSSTGEPYYYINNSKITEGNCNGMVSQKEGCVLFNDTSNPQLDRNADVTYFSSEKKIGDPGGLVAPLDCQTSDSCKRCFRTYPGGALPFKIGDYCQQNTDCSSGYTCSAMHEIYSLILSRGVIERTDVVIDELEPGRVFKLNNANRLVQVRRDRVCGEWLYCSGTNSTFDSQSGRQKVLCDTVDACRQYAKVGQATTQCTEQVDQPDTYRQILSKDLYVSRDVTFKGMDYSGDSIYNQYQAPDLRGVNIGTDENPVLALVFMEGRCFNADGTAKTSCGADSLGYCDSDINGSRCGDRGKCYNHICVTNFRGDPFAPGAVLTLGESNAETASCRAYPEQSSPFPTTTVAKWDATGQNILSKQSGFTGANVCEKQKICVGGAHPGAFCDGAAACGKTCTAGDPSKIGNTCAADGECNTTGGTDGKCTAGTCVEDPNACECLYKKVSYSGGSVTKYFSKDQRTIPSVCIGGPTPGKICTAATDCGNPTSGGGQCVSKQREDTVLGWQGYCLERDKANSINGDPAQFACLTWYPIDQVAGAPDLYNQYDEAGFVSGGFNYYCLQPELYKTLTVRDGASLCWDASEYGECDPGDRNDCKNQISCPDGFVAIIGACEEWGGACVGSVWDDCPYTCIPKGSYHTEDDTAPTPRWHTGDLCFPGPDVPSKLASWESPLNGWLGGSSNYLDHPIYNDCVSYGVSYSNPNADTASSDYFVGCKVAAKISSNSDPLENQAWTDRLWLKPGTTPGYTLEVPSDGRTDAEKAKLRYSYQTVETPFGKIKIGEGTITPDVTNAPAIVPVCREGDTGAAALHWYLTEPDLSCSSGSRLDPPPENEARPHTLIETEKVSSPPGTCTSNISCNSGISCGGTPQCYKSCTSDGDCSSGTCDLVPGDDALKKYCPADVIGGVSSTVCTNDPANPETPGRGGVWLGICSGGPRDGQSCRVRSDGDFNTCMTHTCEFFGGLPIIKICRSRGDSGVNAPLQPSHSEPTALSLKSFSQLFANIYDIYEWKSDQGEYGLATREPSYSGLTRNITSKSGTAPGPSGSVWPSPPEVWPITNCTGDKCVPLKIVGSTPVNGVTIGGINGFGYLTEPKNVVGYGGQYVATMQFFGTADENAGPLRDVIVDWGLGLGGATSGSRDARYKNHLGRDACDDSDFAHSTDACTEDYFQFTNTYTCPIDGAGVTPCTGAVDETDCYAAICPEDVNGGVTGNGSCCVFKPKVQLADNWGWCNGTCPGPPGPTSNGCYLDECEGGTGKDPWTYFAGRVIVVPK